MAKYTNKKRPTVTFHAEQEFIDLLDQQASEVGVKRAEFVKTLIMTIMNYKKPTDKEYMTMTIGELKQKIMPLPDELPVTAYDLDDETDYAIYDLFIRGVYCELGLNNIGSIYDRDWEPQDLFKKKK